MSNFLPLLPLALDAGSPREIDRAVVPESPVPESLPIPEAWLTPPPPPAKRTRAAKAIYVSAMLAVYLGLIALDYFTPATPYVAPTTQDSACPAP